MQRRKERRSLIISQEVYKLDREATQKLVEGKRITKSKKRVCAQISKIHVLPLFQLPPNTAQKCV